MILAALAGGRVDAQDAGPVVVTQQARWDVFQLDDLRAAVEFEWRRDVDRTKPAGGSTRRDLEDRFRGTLELSGLGYVGHPNLLALDMYGEFWLTHRRLDLDTSDRVDHTDEFLFNYDIAGTFLQKQKAPVTLYARRSQNDIDRQFGGTLDNRVEEYGVRVNYRDSFAPTRIQVYRREQEQRDVGGTSDFDIDQDSVEADGQLEIGSGHRVWWDYSYDDVVETGDLRRTLDFDRHEGNVTHTFDFGENSENQFRTAFRYFAEGGDLDFRVWRLLERIRLRHTPNLTTWYDITEEHQDQLDVEQRRREAIANFRHQLFDSLTTQGRLGMTDLNIRTDDFESDQIFGDLIFDYVKRVPLGVLEAGLDLRFSEIEETDRGQPIRINDALFTFDASGLIVIDGQNIITDSIFITDLTGLIVYTEGLDYDVFPFADRVEIRRIPGGDLLPGQSVLIDYSIGPQPGGTTDTTGWGVDFRYTFSEGLLNGVSVYAIYFDQDEDRTFDPDSDIVVPTVQENDFSELRYGIEYNYWRWRLKAEQINRDSSLSPFDALRIEGRYTHRLDRSNAFALSGLYQQIDRDEEDLRTATTTVSGQWTGQLTPRLRGNLLVVWQMDDTNQGADSTNFDQELNLRWRYRQTEIYGRLRNTFRDSDVDDTSFQTITVGVRREF